MTASSPLSDRAWRRATMIDAVALAELERSTNLVGLAHVFGDLPFPGDAVLARWTLVLADPEVVVEVVDGTDGLWAYVAYDPDALRHLGVHPSVWGRGLGAAGMARAIAAGATRLWVLELNARARALYERMGWAPTGESQECPWPPHPRELAYSAQPFERSTASSQRL